MTNFKSVELKKDGAYKYDSCEFFFYKDCLHVEAGIDGVGAAFEISYEDLHKYLVWNKVKEFV